MVDLVKIRKKAKEKKQQDATGGARVSSPAPPSDEPKGADEDTRAPLVDRIARFLQTANERVAVEKQTRETTEELQELLTFSIADELYAIDIEHVVEIITPRPITRIPNAEATIVGILSLRGDVVTIVDVRRQLGHPSKSGADAETRIIVADLDGENLGFMVDRVLRVVKVAPSAIEPQPVTNASEHDEAVRGVFRHNESLTILLNLENLLTANGTDL